MDGGVVVSGGTRIVVVLGFAALSDITPARLSSRLSTPSETSIQIVDRPKLLRTDQNSSSTSSSSVVLFSISFRQQLPGVSSHPLLCSSANAKRFTDPFLCSWSASSCHQKDSFRVYCYGSVIASVVGRFSRTNIATNNTKLLVLHPFRGLLSTEVKRVCQLTINVLRDISVNTESDSSA